LCINTEIEIIAKPPTMQPTAIPALAALERPFEYDSEATDGVPDVYCGDVDDVVDDVGVDDDDDVAIGSVEGSVMETLKQETLVVKSISSTNFWPEVQ
jgi:hypothetical protein